MLKEPTNYLQLVQQKNFKDYSSPASSKLLNVLTLTYNFSASRGWKSMLLVSLFQAWSNFI